MTLTYWDRQLNLLSEIQIDYFNELKIAFSIPRNKEIDFKEAFVRTVNSFKNQDINLQEINEPTKSMAFESILCIWYFQGYNRTGINVVNNALKQFKQDFTIDSLLSGISSTYLKNKVQDILKNNEDRYNKLSKDRIKKTGIPLRIPDSIPKDIQTNRVFGNILITQEDKEQIYSFFKDKNTGTLSEKKRYIKRREKDFEKWLKREYNSFNKKYNISYESFRQCTIQYLGEIKKGELIVNEEKSIFVEYERWLFAEYGEFLANSKIENRTLSFNAFSQGITAYLNALKNGDIRKTSPFTIIDFSLPSGEKRMYLLDMEKKEISEVLYVTHGWGGRRTGNYAFAEFSNRMNSYKISNGFIVTQGTANIVNGTLYSLLLEGKEKGINDNIRRRGITLHGAEYAREPIRADSTGEMVIGATDGCLGIDDRISRRIIDELKGGTGIFIYAPSTEGYNSNTSEYQNKERAYQYIEEKNM